MKATAYMHSAIPFADIPDEPLLNIKAVSQATSIEPVTLRAWERRYGMPDPARSEQGYRLYSERDVAILHWLKAKVDAGVKIKQAVAMLESQTPQSIPHTSPLNVSSVQGTTLETMIERLIDAAHAFDQTELQYIVSQAFALFPVEDVCLNLLIPALQEIGHEWRAGEASLQVEHFLTNALRQQLLALVATMPASSRRGRVLAGCGPNDLHEMAVLTLMLILRRRGWEVVYLGQAVGARRLRETVADIDPDVVLMGASALVSVGELSSAAEIVTRSNGAGPHFVFGGALFPHVPGLSDRIPGVYGGDTLLEAVQRLDGLLAGSWQPVVNEPEPVPAEIAHAYEAVRRSEPSLTEQIAALLVEADPELSPPVAENIAAEAVDELMAALQLNTPQLLDAPDTLTGPSLSAYGLERVRLEALLQDVLGAAVMPALKEYVSRL